jgi:hypothetical protein
MTKESANLYTADTAKLQKAIDSTGESKSKIASKGQMSADTLNKAIKGKRIQRSKANGVCKGLNAFGCKPEAKFEDLFQIAA